MAGKDQFDLVSKAGRGPEPPYVKRVWTLEEQKERLADYVEIHPQFWGLIRYGTHVRYVTKAGEYKSGGFIIKANYLMKTRGDTEDKIFFRLQSDFNGRGRGHIEWSVAHEDVEFMFAKKDAFVAEMFQQLGDSVASLDANIRKLATFAKQLESKIAALEKK